MSGIDHAKTAWMTSTPVEPRTSTTKIIIWIVLLAFLSVGARNFEEGITLDGPFYATIARNIVASHNWFTLNPGIPDLNPFYGNPHLGLWVFATWLKIFPARDWALRIVNHLYYIAFLIMFFHYVRRKSGEMVATITVVLLWSWFQFSNTHSNVYLDPGALFWGSLAVICFDAKSFRPMTAGACLALCALYKSLTFAGFVPALIVLGIRKKSRKSWLILVSFLVIVLWYAALVSRSTEPDFLQRYWSIQITHRFSKIWNVRSLFSLNYWQQLLYYSYYLAPLAFLAFWRKDQDHLLPAVVITSFAIIFSASNLVGGQYLIMILPYLAWLIAQAISPWLRFPTLSLMRASGWVAITGVCLLQYLPIRTHAREIPPELIEIGRLSDAGMVFSLFLETPPSPSPFVISAPFAWYGRVSVLYPASTGTKPEIGTAYYIRTRDQQREQRVQRLGWCRHLDFLEGTLWLPCGSKTS